MNTVKLTLHPRFAPQKPKYTASAGDVLSPEQRRIDLIRFESIRLAKKGHNNDHQRAPFILSLLP